MQRRRRLRILFVRNTSSSFVRNDLGLLGKNFSVRVLDYVTHLSIRRNPTSTIRFLVYLFVGTMWAHLTFSWFGGEHSFWAIRVSRMLGRKSVVVLGGGEVAKIPEIALGGALDANFSQVMKYILANASKVLTVDESLKHDAMRNLAAHGRNITTIPTGHDHHKFSPQGRKEEMVLTVGFLARGESPKRKGLDVFVKAADYLKGLSFVFVGDSLDGSLDTLKSMAGQNVSFVGAVAYDELVRFYQRAKVYCQLSLFEGLPSALCEAMLCQCVPVGTRNGGIPTAIGETGFYVPYGDPRATANAIQEAIVSNKGIEARERIQSLFSLETRETKLVELIHELLP